ncbi:MAG: zinc-binding metallopeptidase family protein [Hyphomicrobium sp.]
MKTFRCTNCRTTVYFENVACLLCGHPLGFDADQLEMVALSPLEAGLYRKMGRENGAGVRYCANAAHAVCNWLTPADDHTTFCRACDLNRTIPNLAEYGGLPAWRDLELAKKRLVYSLLRFRLPLDGGGSGIGPLTFDFVRNVMTGHLDGVITVNVLEADAVERERQRQLFDEPYRSLLGHLRHECGHYYWRLLVAHGGRLDDFRRLFGDEEPDYMSALARHYAEGASPDWQLRHVSAYASCHPHEDWAETWAHYLHMVDAVDTAEAVGMEPRAAGFITGSIWPFKSYDLYRDETFGALMERWIPLTIAMNGLNRSMGHHDYYPFVIPKAAFEKLAFVHAAIRETVRQSTQRPAQAVAPPL